jgi:hypothetical protein
MRPGSGITKSTPGGASQEKRRSHPGLYEPKSSRATGPSRNAELYRLPHLLSWKAEGLSSKWDWWLLIGSFGGTMRERHRSHPKPYNRDPTGRQAPSPMRGPRAVLSVGFAGGRPPVGSGLSWSSRRGSHVVVLDALHWLFQSTSGRIAGRSHGITSLYTRRGTDVKDLLRNFAIIPVSSPSETIATDARR